MAEGKGIEEIRAVKDRYEEYLLDMKNVVGLGIGFKEVEGQETGQLSLVVMVRKKDPLSQLDATDLVPSEIEGVPVDVKEVGEIVALPSETLPGAEHSELMRRNDMPREKGIEEIRAVKDRHKENLLKKKNVVGLGIGYKEVEGQETGQLSLVVMVRKKDPLSQLDATDLVPTEIEGVPVDVKEVGGIVALSS